MRILYVEDDPLQLDIGRRWLEERGHTVIACDSGAKAIRAIERDSFDIAILDWMMPGVSGEDVLLWLRRRHHGTPVLFATANDEEEEAAHILELGADDYLVKPLRRLEFLAHVDAVLRRAFRTAHGAGEVMEVGPYRVEPEARCVRLNGRVVKMTPRMSDIAILLFRKRGELVSRAQIYEDLWGRSDALETRTVDTHVSRVRSALQLDGRHGWRLSSVYQHGYRLDETPA